jgi:hypothetical protein
MRALLLSGLLMGIAPMVQAQDLSQPEPVTAENARECDAALVLIPAHTTPDNRNVWPILYTYNNDPRPPLDCTAAFAAAGVPAYIDPPAYGQPVTNVKGSLAYSRPVFAPDGTVTMDEDVFVAPYFKSLTQYTLSMKDGAWIVTGKRLKLIT